MTSQALHTDICDLFGIDYPIVQTGMGYVAGARLVSATSAAGALGIIAGATLDDGQLLRAIRSVKERTDRPFGVNLRSDDPSVDGRIDMLVREQVKVASFALAPREDLIKRLKDAGIVVVPSVGARRHAEKVAAWGVDAVIVQGGEAGGHTGPIATTILLPQVVDAVDIPVIGAGGFVDGRGLVAALAFGASGVAMGTRFLLTRESTVPDSVKDFYLGHGPADTVVTTKVDGVPHRVLRTDLVDRLERSGPVTSYPRALRNAAQFRKISGTSWRAMIREGVTMKRNHDMSWPQVMMAANTPMLLRAAMVEGRTDGGVMASGQAVGRIDSIPEAGDVIRSIVEEADHVIAGLAGTAHKEHP